jgi:Raf kinase inhibitor-like YbhB/YbcL family protein
MRSARLAVALALVLTGCGGTSGGPASTAATGAASTAATSSASTAATGSASPSASGSAAAITVTSPAFAPGGRIPVLYTCDGTDISPPLRWTGVPAGAQELRLVMRDPDAPGGSFTHWTLSHIPPAIAGFASGHVPAGVVAGRNSFGKLGYEGPCPPPGDKPHRYVITLSAVAGGSVLASGQVVGTYARR